MIILFLILVGLMIIIYLYNKNEYFADTSDFDTNKLVEITQKGGFSNPDRILKISIFRDGSVSMSTNQSSSDITKVSNTMTTNNYKISQDNLKQIVELIKGLSFNLSNEVQITDKILVTSEIPLAIINVTIQTETGLYPNNDNNQKIINEINNLIKQ